MVIRIVIEFGELVKWHQKGRVGKWLGGSGGRKWGMLGFVVLVCI
jgi:hypothetical protein